MNDRRHQVAVRELYARFGLAYYLSECLHRGLCMTLAVTGLPPRELITKPRVDERLAESFSLTLGEVAAKLKDFLPQDLTCDLLIAVENRNFLAHHFWFERAHLMQKAEDVPQLLHELDEYIELFGRLDTRLEQWMERSYQELGISRDVTQDYLRRVLGGDLGEPLPDRQAIRELQKKLSKRQRLIRVWSVAPCNDEKISLIFELEDGSVWQLSDVGLGPTQLQLAPEWHEHSGIAPHLPAEILPRPKAASPWDYEFTLANSAVLWVKPGAQPQTFRWGIRTNEGLAKGE